jgi:hypothetical protein
VSRRDEGGWLPGVQDAPSQDSTGESSPPVVMTLGAMEKMVLREFFSGAEVEVELCERVSTGLGVLIQEMGSAPIRSDRTQTPRPEEFQRSAVLFIATRTLRAIRASLAVLSVGYEVEAQVYDRLLFELRGRLRQVMRDSSGKTAQRWVEGESPTRVSRLASSDDERRIYAVLSQAVHADSNVAARLLDPERGSLMFGPRRTILTRLSLLGSAQIGNEVLEVLAGFAGRIPAAAIPVPQDLKRATAAFARDLEPADATSGVTESQEQPRRS